MERKIAIYTEGGFKLGLGNIYRSLSLAVSIVSRGIPDDSLCFVTSSEDAIRKIIRDRGFQVVAVDDQAAAFSWLAAHRPDLLIIDYLGISETYVRSVKELGVKVALIGNDSAANQYADLVVNAIVGTDFTNRRRQSHATLYLEGPKYLVLRDEFVEKRDRYVYKGTLRTIGLLFGGTDQANLSCGVLEALIRSGEKFRVVLILGSGYKYDAPLNALISRNESLDIHVLRNINNVSEEMLALDFLITSPGTALFEAFCLGVPSLAFFQNESQERVFRDFFMTMRFAAVPDLLGKIKSVYYEGYPAFRRALNALEVGKGKEEIIEDILNL